MDGFAGGFIAGGIVVFVVGTVWAASQFWQMKEKLDEAKSKIFTLEQKVIHVMDGKVEIEWTDANMLVVKPKKRLWEEDVYVAGSDTVIIDDQKDY